jgi:hypothetical protein
MFAVTVPVLKVAAPVEMLVAFAFVLYLAWLF